MPWKRRQHRSSVWKVYPEWYQPDFPKWEFLVTKLDQVEDTWRFIVFRVQRPWGWLCLELELDQFWPRIGFATPSSRCPVKEKMSGMFSLKPINSSGVDHAHRVFNEAAGWCWRRFTAGHRTVTRVMDCFIRLEFVLATLFSLLHKLMVWGWIKHARCQLVSFNPKLYRAWLRPELFYFFLQS